MIFTFTVLQPEGKIQTLSICLESIEKAVEEIAPILLAGHTLLLASCKKSDNVLKVLPSGNLKDESKTAYLQRLKKEWTRCIEHED